MTKKERDEQKYRVPYPTNVDYNVLLQIVNEGDIMRRGRTLYIVKQVIHSRIPGATNTIILKVDEQ